MKKFKNFINELKITKIDEAYYEDLTPFEYDAYALPECVNIGWLDKRYPFEKGEVQGGEIVFDMNSIKATSTGKGDGQDGLTKHLKSEDFFEVETYPEAKYTVKSSRKPADGYKLAGDLSL